MKCTFVAGNYTKLLILRIMNLNQFLKMHLSKVFGGYFFHKFKIDLCLGFEMWLGIIMIINSY